MEYLNCLRVQIVPNFHEEERIQSVIDFCKKHHFMNVMLFINAEEYNVGHMTKEEARPWVETIKKAKERLEKNGISVSLNPWIELGHLARHRTLKENQNFTTMVDFNGVKSELVACPLDEEWQKYFLDFYEYLIKEIKPKVIWVEDDFRLHNHYPLEYGGCFCEKHIRAFNEKLSTSYSREEFKEKLFGAHPDKNAQIAYLDVNRESMVRLANRIGKMIKSLGQGTEVGLMSSMHDKHSMEGRDWYGIHEGLSQGGRMIDRLHLPCYDEMSPKKYYYYFNYLPFICRGLLPKSCDVYPELENSAFSTFTKDSEFLRFQVESALPLSILGMTYDIFDFVGNGAIEAFGYGEKIHKCQRYFDAVLKSDYDYYSLSGITIPIDEKNAYYRNIKPNDFYSLMPDEFHFGAYLETIGISARTSEEKKFRNEMIVLCGASVDNFSEEELIDVFTNNKVIIEGSAVNKICERGLGWILGIKSCRISKAESDLRSVEIVDGSIMINGITEYSATLFDKAGDVALIEYAEEPIILSRFYDNTRKEVAIGQTISKGHFITPFIFDKFLLEQFNPLRSELVKRYAMENCVSVVVTNYEGICAYYSKKNGNDTLILVNTTLNEMNNVEFYLREKIGSLFEIKRTGKYEKVSFEEKNGKITIKERFKPISTKTFLIHLKED